MSIKILRFEWKCWYLLSKGWDLYQRVVNRQWKGEVWDGRWKGLCVESMPRPPFVSCHQWGLRAGSQQEPLCSIIKPRAGYAKRPTCPPYWNYTAAFVQRLCRLVGLGQAVGRQPSLSLSWLVARRKHQLGYSINMLMVGRDTREVVMVRGGYTRTHANRINCVQAYTKFI